MSRRNRPGVVSRALRTAVRAYQLLASPLLPPRCRFLPTCSDYALEALDSHGPLRGTGLALAALGPLSPLGRQRIRSGAGPQTLRPFAARPRKLRSPTFDARLRPAAIRTAPHPDTAQAQTQD